MLPVLLMSNVTTRKFYHAKTTTIIGDNLNRIGKSMTFLAQDVFYSFF